MLTTSKGILALLLLVAVCVGFCVGYEFSNLFGQDSTYVYSSGNAVEYRTNKYTGILQASGPNGWQ